MKKNSFHHWPLLKEYKNPSMWLVGFATGLLVFDVQYFTMANFPGTRNEMCVMGANLTPLNIVFALLLSTMIALLIIGFIQLFKKKLEQKKVLASSVSTTFGLLIGVFSSFCTLCTLPVLSLSGLSVGLEFFTEYQAVFKIISLLLLGAALLQLNKQLKDQCSFFCSI